MNTNAATTLQLTTAPTFLSAMVGTPDLTLSAVIADTDKGTRGLWITRNTAGLKLHEQELRGSRDEVASILAKRMASYGITF